MRHLEVAVALVFQGGRCFLQRRDARERSFPGHWEFPGGKLEAGESPVEALYRELEEELRWKPDSAQELPVLAFQYPLVSVRLHPFRCEGSSPLHCPLAWGWFQPREARRLRLPGASLALLGTLGT